MGTIDIVQPVFMADSLLTITYGEALSDEFAAAISSAVLTPTSTPVRYKGLRPTSTRTRNTAPEWSADIAYVQDEAEGSFSNFLHEHAGETLPFVFEPVAGGDGWAADITISPGAIGGAVDTWGTSTVSLGVDGQPTRIPAT